MKHFLITRFNLRAAQWKTSKSGSTVLTESWLKNRFELFETRCLPSVRNQTDQQFIWLIFFDTETPLEYKEKIKSFNEEFANIHPVFIEGMEYLQSSLVENIKQRLTAEDEFIITSRLDNDDAIHKNYIENIKTLFKPIHQTVIDLRTGYQVTLGRRHSQIREAYNEFNPYISLIEKSDSFLTVFQQDHKKWRNTESVIIYEDERLWCEIVHEENVLNSTRKFSSRKYSFNNENFAFRGDQRIKDNPVLVFAANIKLSFRRILSRLKKSIFE